LFNIAKILFKFDLKLDSSMTSLEAQLTVYSNEYGYIYLQAVDLKKSFAYKSKNMYKFADLDDSVISYWPSKSTASTFFT